MCLPRDHPQKRVGVALGRRNKRSGADVLAGLDFDAQGPLLSEGERGPLRQPDDVEIHRVGRRK